MYVQVRSVDGKQNAIITISKFLSVKEFKKLIQEELNVIVGKQRLFFRGKQLEDEHNVCDYNVNINDVILLMVRPNAVNDSVNNNDTCNKSVAIADEKVNTKENIACESKYFKIGDIVDARDVCYGAWFEAKIIGIYKSSHNLADIDSEIEDGLIYKVLFNKYPFINPLSLSLKEIRPRARNKISALSIKEGQKVMVNYNIERPTQRGFWYDLLVTSVSITNTGKAPIIKGDLFVGHENNLLNDCKIKFSDDIMKIEKNTLVAERTEQELLLMQTETENPRISSPFCDKCHDKTKKCTYCNCHICGLKTDPEKQVLCDECNMAFHIWCLTPPLDKVPEVDEWYCMECKNDENEIIKAGEKLKRTKSRTSTNSRNGGRGMACVGRSKDCTLVPLHHFGAIPGIEVGTTWKFRMQVAEAGIHRPHIAGIHGRETDGAYSIVLSGGYEDDVDNGDEIIYTGSGGRDLTGRRTATQQSCDQTLTRLNKALALNCNASFNPVDGAEAEDWRQGKPVRVIRNFRGARHSKYAPKEGNRYDGLYKVVKYYPEKGKSGFIVWRYLLRRDDAVPAPWTKEGKLRIASLGLEILYPDGYLTAMKKNDKENSPISKGKRKNRLQAHFLIKRPKIIPYELEEYVKKEIENDQKNAKVWELMKSNLASGKKEFLSKVEEQFTCICCHELIFQPVTLKCYHNICLVCLQRSFAAKLYECPYCRTELGKNYKIVENKSLQTILLNLFPGYSSGR